MKKLLFLLLVAIIYTFSSCSEKKTEEEKHRSERIEETGEVTLDKNGKAHTIHLISVIGEVEGHDNLGTNSKTTKYEHFREFLSSSTHYLFLADAFLRFLAASRLISS